MNKQFVMIGAVAVAATCHAGIKYWDNPGYRAFDVDCYVPGAVWNYDGIRNVGATADHDPNALTWANLGSFGSDNDAVLQKNTSGWPNATADELASGTYGEWTNKGFVFKGNSRFRRTSPGRITVGTSYTIQFLVDADSNNQLGSSGYGALLSVQFDKFALCIKKSDGKLYWRNKMAYNDGSDYSYMDGGTYDYGTAIVDGTANTTALFSGIKAPTSGDGFRQYTSVEGHDEAGYAIGCASGSSYEFTGTMKFLRVYNHALTEDELAWNRVVDERRFFDRAAPLPVTNVVVATSVAGAEGTEPSGCYAVDGRHSFTVIGTVNVDGIDYVCTGYTVETLGEGGWSAPVFHKAALYQPVSFLATDEGCVRLTWQWAKAAGLANLYTVDDYVWDGLEVFYDGICNVGTNLPHSCSATNWVNLGSKGNVNDVFVQRLNAAGTGWETATHLDPVGDRDPGYWTENGFRIDAEGRFRCSSGGFNVGTNYSLQALIDAKASDQVNNNYAYLLGANSSKFALRISAVSGNLLWKYENGSDDYPCLTGGEYDYLTAIMREENKQTLFAGTTEPTSGNGYRTDTSCTFKENGFCLGGYGSGGTANFFVGTFKSFREYNRALTAAEVVQNRAVDNWRYFGIPDVTNVIVQSTVPYLRGDEPDGVYAVDGSHVFTAPASVTAKGITYACDGCIVETWDGSTWVNATSYESCSYTYNTSDGLIRLTWKWRATHGLRTAADYSFDDYSQAGLLWNYDGIRNQGGTDADHDSSATTWKNLGSGGSDYDLAFRSGETTTGEWADDGYIFRGGPRFRGGGKVGPLKNFTFQTLIDADIDSQTASSSQFSYIMNAYDNYFNISLVSSTYDGSAASSFCWKAQGGTFMYFHAEDNKYSFATAMMDYDNKKAMMFPDTTIPTEYHKDGTYGAQRLYWDFSSVTSVSTTGYGLGNRNNNGTEGLVGKIKNFRYYDRVLTEEELVRNRNVDAVRYFGALGVTNVFVVAGGGTQTEAGAYKVEGSWTFSATTVLDKEGVEKPVKGFCVQTLEDGGLSQKTWYDGNSFTYSESDPVYGGKTVYLTWSPRRSGMCIIVR